MREQTCETLHRAEPRLTALDVFVPGPLSNPLNGSRGHWSKHARWARQWRDRAGLVLLEARTRQPRRSWPWAPELPKLVMFQCHVWSLFDDDALPGICKPIRDALVDARVIDGDAPGHGHGFAYTQTINRQARGVRITIAGLGEAAR